IGCGGVSSRCKKLTSIVNFAGLYQSILYQYAGKAHQLRLPSGIPGWLRPHVYHGRLTDNKTRPQRKTQGEQGARNMEKNKLLDLIQERKISRRQVNKILAGAGLALTTMPITRKLARADDEVIYFTWAGYDDPGFFPAYVTKHGANPQMPIFADSEEART